MKTVKMHHPELDRTVDFPEASVPHHRAEGWVFADAEAQTPCPTCGRPWPTEDPPRDADQKDQAPAESGASSSEPPRRRKTSKESDD